MLSRLKQMLIKEFIQVFRDKRTRFVLFGPPMAQLLIFGYAATYEIHHKTEAPASSDDPGPGARVSVPWMIMQILLLDLIFSVDSVITAVGMAKRVEIMIAAVLISVGVMIACAGAIGRFVDRHPSIKMLALAFLVLIGVMLMAQGAGEHIPKGYIYFAMAFSLLVEALNIRAGSRARKAA